MALRLLPRPAAPEYLQEARLLGKHARRLVHRHRDLLSEPALAEHHTAIEELEATVRQGDQRPAVEGAARKLDRLLGKLAAADRHSAWRENLEVVLVMLVVTIALRTYFFQPYRIPTGSMQPTLNGYVGHPLPSAQPFPNAAVRLLEQVVRGRVYVDAVSPVEDRISRLRVVRRFFFTEATEIETESGRLYAVNAPFASYPNLATEFGIQLGRPLAAGEHFLHGYFDAGDQVFVDKFTYQFRFPRRDDVFVFRTAGIPLIHPSDPSLSSDFYIKRLAGVPGDTLRIAAPELFVDGERARGTGFGRVMGRADGYAGYANLAGSGSVLYLRAPGEEFKVPAASYFALGDNSYHSSDSRFWGTVPQANVVGRGFFVYWPFRPHWGFVR